MRTRRLSRNSWLTLVIALTIAWPPGITARGALEARQGTAAPAAALPDGGWPRIHSVADGGTATWYQPQVASWSDQKHLVAWSAVAFERKDLKQPALGTIKIEADTKVAVDDRLVDFSSFKITEFNFTTLSREQSGALAAGLQQAIPDSEKVIALDRVLAAIDKSAIRPKDTPGIKSDPPQIFASTKPAVLVGFDGEPIWSPIKDVDLRYAVNTNWDVFEYGPSKTVYLRNNDAWLKATDVKGPWTPAGILPASFRNLPADDNWKEVKANLPGKALAASAVPAVFVATAPAELLLLRGVQAYQAVTGTSLLWISNTESDLFRLGKSGAFYYLVAGRWFSAPSLEGPWTFATPNLPADFRRIPLEHPRSRVLASVPGTDQAAEAVVLAEIPHTARVDVTQLKAPEVTYQGDPQFQLIEGTSLARAANTDKDIIKAGDLYYMCFQGVWFMSRSANGPWEVAKTVPKEIYAIPASSPAHSVTYVTIEQDDHPNDEWVTFAYVAAYTGMAIAWGCAVWGTGWYYPPYVFHGGFYPWYYPYPRTYGFSAWYNPYTGGFGRGAAVYGPYGGAGAAAVFNPITGTYARGAAAYGPYGARGVAQAWDPRTGTYAATRQGSNIYGNWGSSYVQRGDHWAQSAHVTNYARGTSTRAVAGDAGAAVTRRGPAGRTTIAGGAGGDIYAGHNGNVYRRHDGSWQHWSGGGWNPVDKPAQGTPGRLGAGGSGTHDPATIGQLDRDSAARREGAARTQNVSEYRSAPSPAHAGSFRGSGARRR